MALGTHGIPPEEITLHPGEAIFRITIGRLGRPFPFIGADSYQDATSASVVVEAEYGLDLGVLREQWDKPDQNIMGNIVRRADMSDYLKVQTNHSKDDECREVFTSLVREASLEMKLVGIDHSLDQGKITFYYQAEGRVDFRQLVRMLAGRFKRRIELYQLNLRDQILLHPLVGPCGRPLCCRSDPTLLGSHVTSRAARQQGLSYNPGKISGICGRPHCCLLFELESYAQFQEVLGKRPGAYFHLRKGIKPPDPEVPAERYRVVEWSVPGNTVVLEAEVQDGSHAALTVGFDDFKAMFERESK